LLLYWYFQYVWLAIFTHNSFIVNNIKWGWSFITLPFLLLHQNLLQIVISLWFINLDLLFMKNLKRFQISNVFFSHAKDAIFKLKNIHLKVSHNIIKSDESSLQKQLSYLQKYLKQKSILSSEDWFSSLNVLKFRNDNYLNLW